MSAASGARIERSSPFRPMSGNARLDVVQIPPFPGTDHFSSPT